MAEELERLRQQLREAEMRIVEEQRLREEEQRRREGAEAITRPTTLAEFLQACHGMSLTINIVTDRSLTTQGDVT